MENTIPEAKYQKLATEYSKLRAQASVLRKAVLEEQAKNSTTREVLRQRETSLRRSEQEVDSLGFRNTQLQHRVAALQDELSAYESRKRDKEQKKPQSKNTAEQFHQIENQSDTQHNALLIEELQKKIIENAKLTLLIDDKENELHLYTDRITSLEQTLEKRAAAQSELEKRLKRELDQLQCRNIELESKLVEAASMLGSEDALSVAGSDSAHLNHTPQMTNANPNEYERISILEQEVAHWRAKYEIAQISNDNNITINSDSVLPSNPPTIEECSCSTAAAGFTIQPSYAESKSGKNVQSKDCLLTYTKEQLLNDKFAKRYEELLKAKCIAESRLSSFEVECQHLQCCLQDASEEVKAKDESVQNMIRTIQMLEEDLSSTRHNYEIQISVLTEQVISLSEQLASCK